MPERKRKVASPNTGIIAYSIHNKIIPVKEFASFLIQKDMKEIGTQLDQAVSQWNRSLRKEIGERRSEVASVNSANRIDPQDLREAIISKEAKSAIEASKNEGDIISYKRARDFWIFFLMVTCTQRVGALRNIHVQDISNASNVDGHRVITINKHKTGYISPSKMTLDPERFKQMEKFVHLRETLVGMGEEEHLFLSVFKDMFLPMSTSSMDKSIKRFWREAGMSTFISATIVRQSLSTELIDIYPNSRAIIARQFNHSLSTQERHYQLVNRDNEAVKVHKALSSLLSKDTVDTENTEDKEREATEEDMDVLEMPEVIESKKKSSRRTFVPEDVAKLLKSTKDVEALTSKNVKAALLRTKQGKALLKKYEDQYGLTEALKKLSDRVRTDRRFTKKIK